MIDPQAAVEHFDEIDSTLLEARRRAERGEFGPVWLLASKQSAGRGRRGRAWVSGEGNLLATCLFHTERPPGEVALLGFAAGLAIAESLEAFEVRAPVALKWPNDVMIAGAKAAGILIDSGAAGGGRLWAALAFGVNIAVAPGALDQPTTCLRECSAAPAPSVPVFFAGLRPRLESWAARLDDEGFEPLRRAWLARAHGFGLAARVQQGESMIEGAPVGLSARGELELDTPAGRRLIAAGDVYFSNTA
jgi:BirA family transcriptional regulator, biotin operon repressor / biotin---[acetyl-CoA-carboxylase] ligase